MNYTDNHPTINQIVERLKEIVTETTVIIEDYQESSQISSIDISSNIDISLPFEYSFSKYTKNYTENLQLEAKETKKLKESDKSPNCKESSETIQNFENFDKTNTVHKMVTFIFEENNKGKDPTLYIDYFNNNNINLQEVYNWLLNSQNNSDSIFLLGYFNYSGIEINKNLEKAFNLFLKASEKNHILAQYYVGKCYGSGIGTKKDERLAFEYFERIANKDYTIGKFEVGCCYYSGIGTNINKQKAVELYQKAANSGNNKAQCNLGLMYMNGDGIEKDDHKAFELFKKSARRIFKWNNNARILL